MSRTKILCTMGPASSDRQVLERMLDAGMHGARLNFSHGDHGGHREVIGTLRDIERSSERPIPIVGDLQGPKLRIGKVEGSACLLPEGSEIDLRFCEGISSTKVVHVLIDNVPEVATGDNIFINDGLVKLKVIGGEGDKFRCRVLKGGTISSHKGVNLPSMHIDIPSLTPKDIDDLRFALDEEVDLIALSFVRSPDEVEDLRRLITELGGDARVIAKIEKAEAVDRIEEIIRVADWIMIARGDLGVEIPLESLPSVQKRVIEIAHRLSTPVITATQMLDAMVRNPSPTRAEVSDIANAVFDGTDVTMLSAETSVGKYPVESVEYMSRIASYAEASLTPQMEFLEESPWDDHPSIKDQDRMLTSTIAHGSTVLAHHLGADAIIAFSIGGATARRISIYRHGIKLIAASPKMSTLRRCNLLWGVTPMEIEHVSSIEGMISRVDGIAVEKGVVDKGDLAILTAGVPLTVRGRTNMIKVHRVGSGTWA